MQVRVLRTFQASRLKKLNHVGDLIEMDERRAKLLSERVPPLVTIDLGPGKPQQQWSPEESEVADAGSQDPTLPRLSGGPTGACRRASSSRRGRARKTRVSNEPEDALAS